MLLALAAFTSSALAQLNNDPTIETGMKAYGSFEGGSIDSISTTNGNLNLHIPLVSFPQIGGKLHLGFYVTLSNGNYQYTPNSVPSCTQSPYVCGYGTYDNGSFVSIVPDFGLTANVSGVIPPPYGPYASIKTPDGSLHEVGATSTGWRSNDTTGFLCLNNCATVVDHGGLSYNISTSAGGQSQKISDTNGNSFTGIQNASGVITGYTDTLGRTIPLPPSSGALPGFTYSSDTSGCTGALPASSAFLWDLPGYQGGQMQFKICYATVYFGAQTCFKSGGTPTCGVTLQHIAAMQSILLPNNTSWTFTYDSANPNIQGATATGNLLQVALPTGGYIKYSYGNVYMCQLPSSTTTTTYTYSVATRTINSNDGTGEHTWNYSFVSNTGQTGSTPFTTSSVDPLNQKTVHTITALGGVCAYYETQTQKYDSSGNLLKTVITDYHADPDYLAGNTNPIKTASNVFSIRVTTTWPNSQTSKVETDPDLGVAMTGTPSGYALLYGMPIARREYDYGSGSPGALLRQTTTQYQWQSNSNYLTANLLDLVSSTTVLNSSTQVAQTSYGFDENNGSPQGVFGNQTSVTRWFSGGTSPRTQTVYNTQGMPTKTIGAKSNITQITYDSTGLFPKQIQYPTTANGVTHIEQFTYDTNIGKMTSHTDQNSQQTTFGYDIMARLTSVTYPTGGGSETYLYNDSSFPLGFTYTRTINSNTNLVKVITVDGLGRPIQAALTSDPANTTYNLTAYDSLGRVSQVYNPTRCTPPTTNCGESTWGFTSNSYDALDRTIQTTNPDGSTVLTSYVGRATQVQDEGNGTLRVARISQSDGLGRTTSVCEVASGPFVGSGGASSSSLIGNGGTPIACGQDIAGTGFLTTYQFDTLGNLLQVNQSGAGPRTFTYDSLSRLVSATNPESGKICYGTISAGVCQTNGYDLNGNLVTKTDARGIQTTLAYDNLNRLLSKSYSDTTPGATYTYDVAVDGLSNPYPVGRLTKSATNDLKSATANVYDQMGRINNQYQCTPQNCGTGYFLLPYTYDSASNVTSAGNGAGVTIAYGTYSGADRLTSVTSSLSDSSHPPTLFSNPAYTPSGAVVSSKLGNGVTEALAYDTRLRLQSVSATSSTGGTALAGSGSVTIGGAEKTIPGVPAAPGVGTVTIGPGPDRTRLINTCPPRSCPTTLPDQGNVSIAINGVSPAGSVFYNGSSTSSGIATALATAINANTSVNSLVSASASGSIVTITAKQNGPQTDYSLSASSATSDTTYFSGTSFPATASGSALSGGTTGTPTVYDSGKVSITVNGFLASYNYGQNDTSTSIASGLASALSASAVNASASGGVISMTAKTTGSATDYPLSTSVSYDTTHFSSASFTATPSGATLTGGADNSVYSLTLISYAPNGDVLAANDSVNGNWTYGYDPFNRVVSANQNSGQSVYNYVYDSSGNRWQQNGPHTMMLTFTGNATTNNNRADGYSYDLAGNLLNDGANTYTFDAENRIITAGTSTYLYDANGRRVRKTVAGTSVDFLYDLNGRQITEISSIGTWNRSEIYAGSRHLATYSGGTTYFTHADWLATERVRTNVSGGVYETCTSLAFGDWLTCSAGDPSPMHFTGNERDSESSLDNFKARFFGSSMGSFAAPDPVVLSRQKVRDPQQWNSYAYVRNNPLRYRDPTGMYMCMDSKKCDSEQDKAFEDARKRDLKSNDKATRDAAAAYGDQNTDNGVNVGFAKDLPKDCDKTACVQPGIKADAKGNITPNVNVWFKQGLSGTVLDSIVGHEGVHVSDDLNFINSFNAGKGTFDASKNFTHGQTELNGFRVQLAIMLGLLGGGKDYSLLGQVFSPKDMQSQIDSKIMEGLRDPSNKYAEKLNNLVFNPNDYPQQ